MPPGVPPSPLAGVGGPGQAAAVSPRQSSKASNHDWNDGSDGDYEEEFEDDDEDDDGAEPSRMPRITPTAGRRSHKAAALFTAAACGNLSSVRLVLEHG